MSTLIRFSSVDMWARRLEINFTQSRGHCSKDTSLPQCYSLRRSTSTSSHLTPSSAGDSFWIVRRTHGLSNSHCESRGQRAKCRSVASSRALHQRPTQQRQASGLSAAASATEAGQEEEEEAAVAGTGPRPALVFTARAGDLKAAVGRVMSAINRRALANPILDHVLLEAEAGEGEGRRATVMATDGLVAMKGSLPLERVISGGSAAVRAKTLFDFLSQEPAGAVVQVSALRGGAGVAIACGRAATAVLRGQPAGDFPAMPQVVPAVKMVLPRGTLRDALLRTRFAASRDDEGRQNLSSVLLRLGQGRATLLATDGRLFACLTCTPLQVDPSFTGSFILPLRAVDEICRLLGGTPRGASKKAQLAAAAVDREEVAVELQRERIAVRLEDGSIVGSQLALGGYPDVMPLLQQQPQVAVGVDRSDLTAHLRQVALFAGRPGDKAASGAVHLALRRGTLQLSASSGGVGEYEANLDVEYEGQPVSISFNPSLLIDVIQHTDGDPVTVGLSKQGGGGVAIFREPEATFVLGALMDS